MTTTLHHELPPPDLEQRRIATTPSGREVWVPITSADRLACLREIGKIKPRYEEFMKRREAGVPWEVLEREAHCDAHVFREAMAAAWSIYETMLHDIAMQRAKLML